MWTVVWDPEVSDAVVRFLELHPDELPVLFEASDSLEKDPYPDGSVAWGMFYRRARFGRWRMLYFVDESAKTLRITHVGYRKPD